MYTGMLLVTVLTKRIMVNDTQQTGLNQEICTEAQATPSFYPYQREIKVSCTQSSCMSWGFLFFCLFGVFFRRLGRDKKEIQ